MGRDGGKLRQVGAIWKPREGGKSKGSGQVTIKGYAQRFVILPNRYKKPGSKQPDYVLLSSDPPQVDERPVREEFAESGEARPKDDEDF